MSEELKAQEGVTAWHAFPPDFVLLIHLNSKGCPYTEAFSLTPEAQKTMTGVTIFNWTRQAGNELMEIFHRYTKISRDSLRVCSDYHPDGSWLVWIVSIVPMPRVEIGEKPKQKLYGTNMRLGSDGVIDI